VAHPFIGMTAPGLSGILYHHKTVLLSGSCSLSPWKVSPHILSESVSIRRVVTSEKLFVVVRALATLVTAFDWLSSSVRITLNDWAMVDRNYLD
jgi:hypothetical protein